MNKKEPYNLILDTCESYNRHKIFHSFCVKATVENQRGSMEKLSPRRGEESVEGGDTALRGSVRSPKEFSKDKPEVLQMRICPRKIPREPSHCPQRSVGTRDRQGRIYLRAQGL